MRLVEWGPVIFLMVLFWFSFWLLRNSGREADWHNVTHRLSKALNELDALSNKYSQLMELVLEFHFGNTTLKPEESALLHANLVKIIAGNMTKDEAKEPSTEYELLKRKLHSDILEFWWFVSSQIKNISKEAQNISPLLSTKFDHFFDFGGNLKRSLIKDIRGLDRVDGYAVWRKNEFQELSSLIQRRLDHLQNPADCATAKRLVCNLNDKACGFGCQLHHVIYCLIMGYGLERTLILESEGWSYEDTGWEAVFLPLSRTCTNTSGATRGPWRGNMSSVYVMDLPIVTSLDPSSPFLPGAIPRDIAARLTRIHGNPTAWWTGQILKYLLNYQPATQHMLYTFANKVNFQQPIVGVHIRRTDKLYSEASFHSVEEYMEHVEEYFEELYVSRPPPHRPKRIYLATDDPAVFQEIRNKYPDYEVLGDVNISKSALLDKRYSRSSLDGIVTDIHFLARTNFLVCTFSSQVCRIAYEIMNSLVPDAWNNFKSLDDNYYVHGHVPHYYVAILPHTAQRPEEMDLEVGDTLTVAGNHWDGYSKGSNLRSNVSDSLFPSFKVRPNVETAEFPRYPQVPITAPQSQSLD